MSRKATGKIDATAEQVAQAIFAAARPPDPTKRKPQRRSSADQEQTDADEISYMRKPSKKKTVTAKRK